MNATFWLYMLLIVVCALAFQFLIRIPYFLTKDEDEDETEETAEQPVKEKTEQDMFVEAYRGMFNSSQETAEKAYKDTDPWSRQILIEQYQLKQQQ